MRRFDYIQLLPSATWVAFYIIPLLFMAHHGQRIMLAQAFGAALIFLSILAGDFLVGRYPSRGTAQAGLPAVAIVLACLVSALPIVHLMVAGQIPILKILQGSTTSEALPAREHFNKDLPRALAYLFQYVLTVFGPMLIGILIAMRRYKSAGIAVFWCMAYALSSGAKWPSLILLLTVVLLVIALRYPSLGLAMPVFVLATGVSLLYGAQLMSSSLTAWVASGGGADQIARLRKQNVDLSVGDIYRIREDEGGPSLLDKTTGYVVYRTFLGPAEVSSRWFEYFPTAYGGFLGSHGLWQPTSSGRSPANIVGVEVYRHRFPYRYLETVSAYASVDADAYAHWGYLGIVAAGLGLLLLRAASCIGTDNLFGKVTQTAQVALFAAIPFQGSLQALLVSQGALFLMIIQMLWRWRGPMMGEQPTLKSAVAPDPNNL